MNFDEKLLQLKEKYKELEQLLMGTFSDPKEMAKISKEYSDLKEVIVLADEYLKMKNDMAQAEEMMKDDSLKEIAEAELVTSDLIKQKWELLTTKQNLLPTGYKSVLPNNASLVSYSIDGDKLTINTTDNIKDALGRQAVEAVAWTFCNHDIKEVVIFVGEEVVDLFDDFHFKKISKDVGINFKYETMFLYEANYTTIITENDGLTIPVTYVHQAKDECDYIVSKILGNSVNKKIDEIYSYELEEKELSFQFLDKSLLTSNILNNLAETVYLNLDVDTFTINDTESVLYEVSYVVDTNK